MRDERAAPRPACGSDAAGGRPARAASAAGARDACGPDSACSRAAPPPGPAEVARGDRDRDRGPSAIRHALRPHLLLDVSPELDIEPDVALLPDDGDEELALLELGDDGGVEL